MSNLLKMQSNSRILKYGISMRLAEESDASFILTLRLNVNRSKYLSTVSSDLHKQEEWLREYKIREKEGKEYYFIIEVDGVAYGTTRIYKITENSFETGSWIFSEDAPQGVAVKGDILGREFAFEILKKDVCTFEVRKINENVIRYHKGYKPDIVGEDDLNFYFQLSKDAFYLHSQKLLKIHGYGR